MNGKNLIKTIKRHLRKQNLRPGEVYPKNDSDLATMMGMSRSTISGVKHLKRSFGPDMVLACYEKLGISIEQIREWQAQPDFDDGEDD